MAFETEYIWEYWPAPIFCTTSRDCLGYVGVRRSGAEPNTLTCLLLKIFLSNPNITFGPVFWGQVIEGLNIYHFEEKTVLR
jgi:hypothetical protein